MGYSENLHSYLNMTRKELQQLCKKHNIPANKSHAHLAKSLASLCKPQINANAVCPSTANHKSSKYPISNLGNILANCPGAANMHKTNATQLLGSVGNEFGNRNKYFSELRDSNQEFLQDDPTDNRTCNTEKVQCGHSKAIKCSNESGFASSHEISTIVPSFQFFVTSEAGINLYVDLESNPIEWINSLKDGISIDLKGENHDSSAHNCGLPHADDIVENLPSGDIGMELQNSEVEQNIECTNSALSSVVNENGNSEAYPPDAIIATSGSSVLTSGSAPTDLGCLEENQVVSSSTHLSQVNLTTDIVRAHEGGVFVHGDGDTSCGMAKSFASASDSLLKATSNANDVTIDCPTNSTCADYGDIEANAPCNTLNHTSSKNNNSEEVMNSIEDFGSTKNQSGAVENLISRSSVSEVPDKVCGNGGSSTLCQITGQVVSDGVFADAQSEGCSTTVGKGSEGANCKRSSNSQVSKELPSKRQQICSEYVNGALIHQKGTKNLAKEMTSDAVITLRRSTRLIPK